MFLTYQVNQLVREKARETRHLIQNQNDLEKDFY